MSISSPCITRRSTHPPSSSASRPSSTDPVGLVDRRRDERRRGGEVARVGEREGQLGTRRGSAGGCRRRPRRKPARGSRCCDRSRRSRRRSCPAGRAPRHAGARAELVDHRRQQLAGACRVVAVEVIASRADPAIRLGRAELEGQLGQLRRSRHRTTTTGVVGGLVERVDRRLVELGRRQRQVTRPFLDVVDQLAQAAMQGTSLARARLAVHGVGPQRMGEPHPTTRPARPGRCPPSTTTGPSRRRAQHAAAEQARSRRRDGAGDQQRVADRRIEHREAAVHQLLGGHRRPRRCRRPRRRASGPARRHRTGSQPRPRRCAPSSDGRTNAPSRDAHVMQRPDTQRTHAARSPIRAVVRRGQPLEHCGAACRPLRRQHTDRASAPSQRIRHDPLGVGPSNHWTSSIATSTGDASATRFSIDNNAAATAR